MEVHLLVIFLTTTIIFQSTANAESDGRHCLWPSSKDHCRFCERGWYGDSCDRRCVGHCDIGGCKRKTGLCLQCKSGFYTENCSAPCPSNCGESYDDNVYCDRHTGNCLESCKPSWWGAQCQNRCSDSCINGECYFYDGTCEGCKAGKTGPKCDKICSVGCIDDNCYQWHGKCTKGCKGGYYGERCHIGLNCIDKNCSFSETTGVVACLHGCVPGKMGTSCTTTCSGGCINYACNQYVGTCVAGCKAGYHGRCCNITCSHCFNGNCSFDECTGSATCNQGCLPGKMSPSCLADCPDNCTSCEQTTGKCEICKEGFWGPTCSSLCDRACFNKTCNMEGNCDSCNPGAHGPRCNQTCPDGCSNCSQAACTSSLTKSVHLNGVTVGIGIGIALAVLTVVLLVFYAYRKRKKSDTMRTRSFDNHAQSRDELLRTK